MVCSENQVLLRTEEGEEEERVVVSKPTVCADTFLA